MSGGRLLPRPVTRNIEGKIMERTYRPDQRRVPTRFLTPTGWMSGTFHLPTKGYFLDYLNLRHTFLRLTEVEVANQELPFLALQKKALVLVHSLEKGIEMARPIIEMKVQEVTCILDQGFITGSIDILHMTRMSDFFKDQDKFVLIRDCTVVLPGLPGSEGASEHFDGVLLNAQHIHGVTEPQAPE